MNDEYRHMKPLTREQSLRRLGAAPIGRIVFSYHAMPAIRPGNHMIDEAGRIVIASHEGAPVLMAASGNRGAVVSYEADEIDPVTHAGWSVIVTGVARIVEDPQQSERYRQTLIPWANGHREDHFIRIEPSIVTGYELAVA